MVWNRRVHRALASGLMIVLTGSVAACGSSTTNASGGNAPKSHSTSVSIGFFGFSSANSFAQATWTGVQKAAKQMHATAYFLNGNFSATTQVQQMKDALVSKQYNVWVVQANDGASVVPEVEKAEKEGIAVVAEFTPIGTQYNTDQPQVPGTISFIDVPSQNGTALGKLGIEACGSLSSCNVAYLQGDPSLPLDNARTQAALKELTTDHHVHVIGSYVGGYTQSQGMTVGKDLLAAHPNVNVIIGSSQAIEGVQIVLEHDHLIGKIKLVGNGGSIQAVDGVHSGAWFATYYIPEITEGYDATKYGIEYKRGQKVPMATNAANVFPVMGTAKVLKGIQGQYED